jgi:hypothetical protein
MIFKQMIFKQSKYHIAYLMFLGVRSIALSCLGTQVPVSCNYSMVIHILKLDMCWRSESRSIKTN